MVNNDVRLLTWIRQQLVRSVVGLVQKFNNLPSSPYPGYVRGGSSDVAYMHIQKTKLGMDVKWISAGQFSFNILVSMFLLGKIFKAETVG
jgi:hypothetical protein